ncbi:putative zinc finger protein [Micromonospora sp. Llam0]|uniref:zf-HC2 domain-containing protein n=1 Tax=Micromonospora sp. Llam0 TaxID=2485143 RepID=UPI000F492B2B|nr:zf-HC2 domain-containing protein [Micromonospora sp. Llam0]ROO63193.1 putative zinc finger protein [Micromonospora sp. Llam0]
MNDAACHDRDVHALLGFYVIGKLDDDERRAVDRHLSDCSVCRAARDEIGPVVPALRLLGRSDVRDLVAEFGVPTMGEVRTAPAPDVPAPPPVAGSPAVVDRPVVADGPDAGRPPRRSERGGAPPGRPAATKRRWRRWQLSVGGLVVVVLAGAVATIVAQWPEQAAPQPAGITASGDSSAGVTIEIEIDAQIIRVTLDGLRSGLPYELYAVTGDGGTFRVAELTGASGAQEVEGELPVPADTVAFFSVRQADGAVVVTAEVGGAAPTDPPR